MMKITCTKFLWLRFALGLFLILPIICIGNTIGDHLFILLGYGKQAYIDGLRVLDSKHGILSTGQELSFHHQFLRIGLILLIIFPAMAVNISFMCGRIFISKKEKQDQQWDKAVEQALFRDKDS